MNVVYFFRKSFPGQHSIEELFKNVQNNLPAGIHFYNHFVKYRSKGIVRRLLNCIEVIFYQKDINHITGDIHYVAFFLTKKKTVLTIHDIGSILSGSWLKRRIIKLFWFYLPLKRIRCITVISEFTKKELIKHINIKPSKIIVIPNCVSPLIHYEPKQFNKEKPTILQIGTKKNKNIPNLINAVKTIDCNLIIVGQLDPGLTTLLKINNINYENCKNIDFNDLILLYKKADIITLISTYEGFGIPIIEANAIGRPVITSNVTSMPEVANDAAIIVDPYNIEEIKRAILKIINDDEFRQKLIINGLENVKRYDPGLIAGKYTTLYKKIMAQ